MSSLCKSHIPIKDKLGVQVILILVIYIGPINKLLFVESTQIRRNVHSIETYDFKNRNKTHISSVAAITYYGTYCIVL